MATRAEARKPSTASEQHRVARFGIAAQQVATVLQTLIRWGGGIWIAWIAQQAVSSLAGQQTEASIVVNFLGHLTTNNVLGWGVGALAIGYGLGQKRLRQWSIERLSGRITEYEKSLDAGRTSSDLTSRGKTNPKDKR